MKKQKTKDSKTRKISGLAFLIVLLIIITPFDGAFALGTDTFSLTEAKNEYGDLSHEEDPEFDTDNESEGLFSIETPEMDSAMDTKTDPETGEGYDDTDALDLSEVMNEEEYSDVTISNTITGKYADMTKTFLFTIYLTDSMHNEYAAGKKIECEESVLILTEGGKAEFFLAHEQKITLNDLPADTSIRIVQTAANGYRVSFKDSENEAYISENDTEPLIVGAGMRSFDFENNRTEITPVGISGGSASIQAAVLLLLSILLFGVSVFDFIKRRKCEI